MGGVGPSHAAAPPQNQAAEALILPRSAHAGHSCRPFRWIDMVVKARLRM
jgi:hypothetical protein